MKLPEVLRKVDKEMPRMPLPKTNRSHFQLVLDNLDAAHKNMHNAAMLLVGIAKSIETEMEHVSHFRHDLIHTIEGDGGQVASSSIEEEIAAYIPKRGKDGQDQKIQTGPEDHVQGPA